MASIVYNEDCMDKLKELPDNSIDSIVTDPPYELCFMGKSWDNTGIAYNVKLWSECLRVLKPGGHLLAFGGTRIYHRMAVAIEDAGFKVRDMIEWVYGSGFPKSLNIGKAVDKLQGNEREVIGKLSDINPRHATPRNTAVYGGGIKSVVDGDLTKGTSEWEGWGTALKPAHEPICMARKPLSEKTVAENCLKWRTGGINIDESRVVCDLDTEDLSWGRQSNGGAIFGSTNKEIKIEANNLGRFPANLIHDGSEEVRECFPETTSGGGNKANKKPKQRDSQVPLSINGGNWEVDTGNASRFFKSIFYTGKATKAERNRGTGEVWNLFEQKEGLQRGCDHPTVKPVELMEYLVKMVTYPGGVVLDPFMGSGTTGVACIRNKFIFIGIEMDTDYYEIAKRRIGDCLQPVQSIQWGE